MMEDAKRMRIEIGPTQADDEQPRTAAWLKPGNEKEQIRFLREKIVWSDGVRTSPPNGLYVFTDNHLVLAFHWNGNTEIMPAKAFNLVHGMTGVFRCTERRLVCIMEPNSSPSARGQRIFSGGQQIRDAVAEVKHTKSIGAIYAWIHPESQ